MPIKKDKDGNLIKLTPSFKKKREIFGKAHQKNKVNLEPVHPKPEIKEQAKIIFDTLLNEKKETPATYFAHVIYKAPGSGVLARNVYPINNGIERNKHPDPKLVHQELRKIKAHTRLTDSRHTVAQIFGSFNSSSENADSYIKEWNAVNKAKPKPALKKEEYDVIDSATAILTGNSEYIEENSPIDTIRNIIHDANPNSKNDNSPAKYSDDYYIANAGKVSGRNEFSLKLPPSIIDIKLWQKKRLLVSQGTTLPRITAYMDYAAWADKNNTSALRPMDFHHHLLSVGVHHSYNPSNEDVLYHNLKLKATRGKKLKESEEIEIELEENRHEHFLVKTAKMAVRAWILKKIYDKYHNWQARKATKNNKTSLFQDNVAYDPTSKKFWGHYTNQFGERSVLNPMSENKFRDHMLTHAAPHLGTKHELDIMNDKRTGNVTHQSLSNAVDMYTEHLKSRGEIEHQMYHNINAERPSEVLQKIHDHLNEAALHRGKHQRIYKNERAHELINHPETGEAVVAKQYHKKMENFHKEKAKELGWSGK